jgi:hypothetical protein
LKDAIDARKRIEALEVVPGVKKEPVVISAFDARLRSEAEKELKVLDNYTKANTVQRLKMAERITVARKKLKVLSTAIQLSPEQKVTIKKFDEFSA